jgi:peptidoglycan hydrolase CwlO-like protein
MDIPAASQDELTRVERLQQDLVGRMCNLEDKFSKVDEMVNELSAAQTQGPRSGARSKAELKKIQGEIDSVKKQLAVVQGATHKVSSTGERYSP